MIEGLIIIDYHDGSIYTCIIPISQLLKCNRVKQRSKESFPDQKLSLQGTVHAQCEGDTYSTYRIDTAQPCLQT